MRVKEEKKMKVDKAVCTTDTMTDAEGAISYENLLSTLVQKKILAIKRECEAKKVAKQRRKQQNCLGSLIFGNRHHDRTNKRDDGEGDGNEVVAGRENEATAVTVATDDADPSISTRNTVTESKENMRKSDDDNRNNQIARSILLDNQERGESIVMINHGVGMEKGTMVEIELTKCHIDVLNERTTGSSGGGGGGSRNGDNDNNTTHDHSDFHTSNVMVKNRAQRYSTHDNTSGTLQMDAMDVQSKSDNSCIELDVESTSTTTNSKSPSIVSQIEVSDEINPKQFQRQLQQQQQKLRVRKNSGDTISVPSSMKHTTLSAPAVDAMALHDHEQRHQKRLLEAKSISAQCSPILTQRQTFNGMSLQLFFIVICLFVFFAHSPVIFLYAQFCQRGNHHQVFVSFHVFFLSFCAIFLSLYFHPSRPIFPTSRFAFCPSRSVFPPLILHDPVSFCILKFPFQSNTCCLNSVLLVQCRSVSFFALPSLTVDNITTKDCIK